MMEANKQTNNSKADAKDLLLEDYRHLADSFWKNEQTGETRVNWFIGIVTAVSGGLVTLASAEHGPRESLLILIIIIVALFWLLVFGIITLFRIVKRNAVTDGYKQDFKVIRQIFKDHFDGDSVLRFYQPFAKTRGPGMVSHRGESAAKECSEPDEEDIGRKLGGLAHTVSAINSLLAAGLVGAIIYFLFVAIARRFDPAVGLLIMAGMIASLVFVIAFKHQNSIIKREEQRCKKKFREGSVTHAGGIVYRAGNDNAVAYLIVGPENGGAVNHEWFFPKGHIENNEEHGEAALREVREETGVIARLICLVDRIAFSANGERVDVKFYLMESFCEHTAEEVRPTDWLPFEGALDRLTHDESKYLLRLAEHKRVS